MFEFRRIFLRHGWCAIFAIILGKSSAALSVPFFFCRWPLDRYWRLCSTLLMRNITSYWPLCRWYRSTSPYSLLFSCHNALIRESTRPYENYSMVYPTFSTETRNLPPPFVWSLMRNLASLWPLCFVGCYLAADIAPRHRSHRSHLCRHAPIGECTQPCENCSLVNATFGAGCCCIVLLARNWLALDSFGTSWWSVDTSRSPLSWKWSTVCCQNCIFSDFPSLKPFSYHIHNCVLICQSDGAKS